MTGLANTPVDESVVADLAIVLRQPGIACRAHLPDMTWMKPAELLRRLRRLATRRGWRIVETEGGNHTKVVLNGRRTVIGRHRTDLKTGTLLGILKQLGLHPSDLEE